MSKGDVEALRQQIAMVQAGAMRARAEADATGPTGSDYIVKLRAADDLARLAAELEAELDAPPSA